MEIDSQSYMVLDGSRTREPVDILIVLDRFLRESASADLFVDSSR